MMGGMGIPDGEAGYTMPCSPIATSSIADANESTTIVAAQTARNATIVSVLVSQ